MTAEELVSLLEQRDLRPKSTGPGKWQARCAAHDDRVASLAIGVGQDGRLLLHCHAGCELADLLAALGLAAKDLFAPNGRQPATSEYRYTDARGAIVFKVVRMPGEQKKFRQARPDGAGGWAWNLDGTERVLYRLPNVLAAVVAGETIYVAEGEKDVDALEAAGVVATTNPGGALKWRDSYSKTLAGATVVVVADRDEPGRRHARQVAESLRHEGCNVRIVEATAGKDAHDHLAAGLAVAAFTELADDDLLEDVGPTRDASKLSDLLVGEILAANPNLSAEDLEDVSSIGDLKKLLGGKTNIATEIVKLATDAGASLFHDPNGRAFATIDVNGHAETHAVKSGSFKNWIRRLYHQQKAGAALNAQSVSDAVATLEAQAEFDGPEIQVHLRVAQVDGCLYIDLGDELWRTIAITCDGGRITDQVPVRFRRTKGMAALPDPVRGGSLEALRPFLNIKSKDDDAWRLIVGFLLAAARPDRPCPVLTIGGEMGSAKSSAARVLRELIDPSTVLLRSAPTKVDDLMVSASSSWMVTYDNVSHLQPWLSDALCRLCTGAGLSKRELYSDADEILLSAQRPVILTGIGELAERSDLLDRAITIELPTIAETAYSEEKVFWEDFYGKRGEILGGLYDALSAALAKVDQIHLDRPTRMADFAVWICAAESSLGWKEGSFLKSYSANRGESHELAVEASAIGPLLRTVAAGGFEGTLTELLERLNDVAGEATKRLKEWPTSARSLSSAVTRIAPNLRKLGYVVDRVGSGHHRTIVLGRAE